MLTTCASLGLLAGRAAADDPWWGRDKALHLGVSSGIAGVTYGIAALLGASRPRAAILSGSVAFGLGIGKEGADLLGLGDPSWKDLTWDAIGTTSGVGIALLLDLLLRQPVQVAPRVSRNGYGLSVAWFR